MEAKIRHILFNRTDKWTLAAFIIFFIVSIKFFIPSITPNESVYLINARKIIEPEFLANDWTWQSLSYSHFVFDLIISKFFHVFSFLSIALLGRVITWILVIWSLIRLAKTLGLEWWGFILSFLFWLYGGQSLIAGEWIFSGFESKSIAYAFLFLSLQSILRTEVIKGAIFCGISICFHVLVGCWGAVGLFVVVLLSWKEFRYKKIILFSFLVFLFSLPGLISNVYGILRDGHVTKEAYKIYALFRTPHHLDPEAFMSTGITLLLFGGYILTVLIIYKSFKRKDSFKLNVFLTTLMTVFVLGLLARKINLFSFLNLYPFRLGPLFLFLFFSLAVIRFIQLYFIKKKITMKTICVSISLILLFMILFKSPLEKPLWDMKHFLMTWKSYLSKTEEDNFVKLTIWIKDNTDSQSIFISPPWIQRFWMFTERAEVVCFKFPPASGLITEWYARLVDLNGGKPFKNKGLDVNNELIENYPNLTFEQLLNIKSKYKTQYLLTIKERQDLSASLIYSNKSFYLYDLRDI